MEQTYLPGFTQADLMEHFVAEEMLDKMIEENTLASLDSTEDATRLPLPD